MGALLSYSIVSGVIMLALYLAYKLFLSLDNQHGFNRVILLLIYLVSFITVPVVRWVEKLSAGPEGDAMSIHDIEVISTSVSTVSVPAWGTIMVWAFILGMIAVASNTLIIWFKLTRVISSGKKIHKKNYILVITDDKRFAPFSWLNYIVISRKDFEENNAIIEAHELKHIASRHWIDLMLAQIVCIVNWFNPVAWLMRDELMLIHEYQADMAVITGGHNPQEYQTLLIKKAVGARFPSLANSLNHSKLKKRITMMYKEKSGAGGQWKALALVPMFALALGVVSIPAVRAAVSTISRSEVSVGKVNENNAIESSTVKIFKVTDISNDGDETTVVVKGENVGNNLSVSGAVLTNNDKNYGASAMECNMVDGEAVIKTKYPVSESLKKSSMILLINGERVQFNLENYLDDPATPASGKIVSGRAVNGISTTATQGLGQMKICIDGKEVTEEEMKNLPTDKIDSITVDKVTNTISVVTKK
ncbi:MAG: M56 family metallopeptidase [Muribaculaceae bacterium]|nr:M56 family metallopeptidase [Muribaculaceae bacterium]